MGSTHLLVSEPADIRRGIHRENGIGVSSHRRIVMLEFG